MDTRDISYSSGDKTLTGYLADGAKGSKAPGILVCHQGGGLTEHAKERARMLAELGYVAFALDLYGVVPTSIAQAQPLMMELLTNPAEMRKRAHAGFEVLKAQPHVDTKRLAAIGFCMGGGLVLELSRVEPDIACVVAFHPGMSGPTGLPEKDDRKVMAKVMVCAGVEDPLIPPEARENFINLMKAAGADWQFLTYGNAGHSFTDKSVDALNMNGFKFHAATDKRSWAAMRELFDETFGTN
jgi:dienelactone hydrolase